MKWQWEGGNGGKELQAKRGGVDIVWSRWQTRKEEVSGNRNTMATEGLGAAIIPKP